MTESLRVGHDPERVPMHSEASMQDNAAAPAMAAGAPDVIGFDEFYQQHFAFVWRTLRRLGVPQAHLDDVVQEVFLVVHRRLEALETNASRRAWLYGITAREASEFHRTQRRKDPRTRSGLPVCDAETLRDSKGKDPLAKLEEADGARVLCELLDELDWSKREVFVLVELEEMSVPEVAEALGVNPNTVYSRIRVARQQFNDAVVRFTARSQWRTR